MTNTAPAVVISGMKTLLPFGAVLLSVGMAWGNLNGQLNLSNQKIDTIIAQNTSATNKLGDIESREQQMAIDIAKLQQVIADNQSKGLLSQKPVTSVPFSDQLAINITPIPTAMPAQNINVTTNYAAQSAQTTPQNQSQSTPVPTPTPGSQSQTPTQNPTPTPQPATGIILPVITGIVSLLGL